MLQEDDRKESFVSSFGIGAFGNGAEDTANVREYGTKENQENLKRTLSKLILCVEMENWEKAEMFMETVKQLTEGAPREISRLVLRLKMAIQKENYDKVSSEYKELIKLV